MQRAYSTFHVKAVDADARIIEGIASTPSTDRMGDIVEPKGAQFSLPLPLLWQHRSDEPIGHVIDATVTKDGIRIKAQIAKDVLPRIDEAWALIKSGLVRGLSIGFKALETAQIDDTLGLRFLKWDWLELSAVTIPANADASVTLIRSIDSAHLAASGNGSDHTPGVTGARVVAAQSAARGTSMKSITEQKAAFVAEKEAKVAALNALMSTDGTTLDASTQENFDTISDEIDAIDKHLARLEKLEQVNKAHAKPVAGDSQKAASDARGGVVITAGRNQVPEGIGFIRSVLCNLQARLDSRDVLAVAKSRYPSDDRLHAYIEKGAVPAGTTTQASYASSLVYADNLASEFIDYLRPMTLLGKIPGLKRVPFNIRVPSQTSAADAYWVGEGAPAPLTSFATNSVTLGYTKLATIAAITKELARFSSPNAEQLVRNELAAAMAERADIDFIDPAKSLSANVSPASITNGLVALPSAGTSADNARTDVQSILVPFIEAHYNTAGLVLVMPNTLALALSLLRNSFGQPAFPSITLNGGYLEGIPVVTSQYAANVSGGGNLVIALSAPDIYLADDGGLTVEASDQASIQMLDNPTNHSGTGTATTMVSMFQTDSIAIKAVREICWKKRRSDAVVYMDDVNWGSVGSPA